MKNILLCLIISTIFIACGEVEELLNEVNQTVDSAVDDVEGSPPVSTPEPTPEPVQTTNFYTEDNCDNPPVEMNVNNDAKCQASATRGGSVVCLLPHRFTWSPYTTFTDHHGISMRCNVNDDRFDKVELIQKNGRVRELVWDKCQNYVATAQGFIGRQHWRNESLQWDNIKNKVERIKMTVNGQKTCLRFN